MFGSTTPPAEAQAFYGRLKNYLDGNGDTWTKVDSASASKYLKETLEKRLGDINTSRQSVYADYMQTHEVDAFLSGQRVRSQAMARGYKPAPEIQSARRSAAANAEIEYILDNAFESIGRHVGHEAPAVKAPRLFFEGGQGTASNYDLSSDSIIFDHASVTVKRPAAQMQHQFNRTSFRDGEELSVRGLTDDLPGLSKVKVVTANSERVSLRYEGPYTTSRQAMSKANNEIDQLDDFIAQKIAPKLTEPNFSAAASAEGHVRAALLIGDNLGSADASVLNYALKNSTANSEFRPLLFTELARRAQAGTLPEKTAYLWFNEIGSSLKSDLGGRARAYKEFLDYTPPALRDQITKSGEADELLRRAFNAIGDGNSWPIKGSVAANWATGEVAPVVRQLEKIRNHVLSSGDFRKIVSGGARTQLTIWTMLSGENGIVSRLQKEKRIGPDWQVYPTEAGSPLDRAGGDYLLVNTKTGDFHFLDATSNPEKSNVFELRKPGVIYTENNLFDVSGALKIDDPSSTVRNKATNFKPNLEDQIIYMTQQPAAFRLGADGPPLPSLTRVSEADATTQLTQLVDWAKAKARNSADTRERSDWLDMANVVERARKYSNIQATQVASPELGTSLDAVTKVELINYAMGKLGRLEYGRPSKVAPVSEVQIVSKDRTVMLKTKSGEYYNGGNLDVSIETARREFLDLNRLSKSLSNTHIDALGGDSKALKGLNGADRHAAIEQQMRTNTKFQNNVRSLSQVFMNDQNVIRNGGATGGNAPVILENISSKLRSRTEESLLGKPAVVVAKFNAAANAANGRIDNIESSLPEASKLLKEWKEPPARLDAPAENISDILDLIIDENNSIPVDELVKLKGLRDAYKDPKNPDHARVMKMIHDLMTAE